MGLRLTGYEAKRATPICGPSAPPVRSRFALTRQSRFRAPKKIVSELTAKPLFLLTHLSPFRNGLLPFGGRPKETRNRQVLFRQALTVIAKKRVVTKRVAFREPFQTPTKTRFCGLTPNAESPALGVFRILRAPKALRRKIRARGDTQTRPERADRRHLRARFGASICPPAPRLSKSERIPLFGLTQSGDSPGHRGCIDHPRMLGHAQSHGRIWTGGRRCRR